MSMRANYFKLGLFVIVATAILVGGVIVLGAGQLLEKKTHIETYMQQSVQGLDVGADVKFRGVRLGSVSKITLAYKEYDPDFFKNGSMDGDVLVEIALPESDYVDVTGQQFVEWVQMAVGAGLRTRMASSGLTGPAYLELTYLDPAEFPPPPISWTPPDLYIPSAPSEMRAMLNTIEAILKKLAAVDVGKIADDLDTLLVDADKKVNELDVKRLNDDAGSLLEEARAKVDQLDVQAISDKAVALLDEVRDSNHRIQEILNNPNIDPALEDLRATLENARDATARFRELLNDPKVQQIIDNLERTTEELPPALTDIRRTVRRIDRLIASQQETIEAALQKLREVLDNVDTLTEDAKENPSRILFGDPPPRNTPGGDR